MIEGAVNAAIEAALESIVALNLVGPSGQVRNVDAVVALDAYAVTVLWDGRPREIVAYAAETTPLAGMSMLDSHSLYVEVESGGRVAIEAR